MKLVIYYFLFINAFTFLMCLIDKEKAKRKRGRIPEKLFFLNSFFGGFLGLILGMKLFHHKTKKKVSK